MIYLISVIIVALLVWGIGLASAGANWGGTAINWIDGWVRLLARGLHRLPKQQLDLPKTGPAIVVANHISGLDPLLLIAMSPRPLRFLIAREHYDVPIMNRLYRLAGCIPVDRTGRPETALREALTALKAGEVLGIFPQGGIRENDDPQRVLKAGFARLAYWSAAPVFPVRIEGVTAKGRVLLAPFVPSRVRITMAPAFQCLSADTLPCLQRVVQHIETPIESSGTPNA